MFQDNFLCWPAQRVDNFKSTQTTLQYNLFCLIIHCHVWKKSYHIATTFTCLIFSTCHSGVKFCCKSWRILRGSFSKSSAHITSPHSAKSFGIAAERQRKAESRAQSPNQLPLQQAEQMLCAVTSALAWLLPSLRAAAPGQRGPAPQTSTPGSCSSCSSTEGTAAFALMHLFVCSSRSLTRHTW